MSQNLSSASKLRVAVIGGGISGLATAAFLRKCPQYSITVYERRGADFKETSATFGLRGSGISIVKQLGITKQEINGIVGAGYRIYNTREELMSKAQLGNGPDGDGDLWFVFRQDLKDALLRRATSEEGKGKPIQIMYGSHIVRVDPEAGRIHFADRASVDVDLIIGADGINSKVRAAIIPPSHPQPAPCGLSVYCFMIPMEVFKESMAAEGRMPDMFNYEEGYFIAIVAAGDEGNRNVVMLPCREHRFMSVACAVPDSILKNPARLEYSWNAKGSVEELVDNVRGFPEWLGRLYGRMSQVELFQVRDQEPLPTYVKGRAVLMGDAAHPMVPYQGQGANQCLEDVEGLHTILENLSNGDLIPDQLRIWDSIRRPRASAVQQSARVSQSKISTKEATQALLAVKPYVRMKDALAARVRL
ncbi:hypothetical protein N7449_011467 [Penicillium cf. viridicatum]|uniref:FAD-binding domain-containing protein n=1 Tax=Penicillium cf. viridicatum TaxID=2972119 RepID=A0A9W9IX44_9EURO|nr:hypothetical protein N7449_011467 [Penicillium cf. viridicatum]